VPAWGRAASGGAVVFPGGKVETGESPEVALARELEEELGVAVDVGEKLAAVVEWTDGEVAIRLSAYWCRISEGEPMALEHEELRWGGISELGELGWAEADLPFVRELGG